MLHCVSDPPVLPGVHGSIPEAGGPIPLPLPLDPLAGVVDPDIQCMGNKKGFLIGLSDYHLLYLSLEK